jgi:hypothetical protein
MAAKQQTLCGYELADVRRALRDAIDRREQRTACRWTAEFVATPGAVGSLWAACWLAWAAAAGGPSPTLPILLRQSWGKVAEMAHGYGGDWTAFRNDPQVRAEATEIVTRLLGLPRQTPVVWPTKELVLYDVSMLQTAPVPAAADGPAVMRVWQRGDDALEFRLMAGRWIDALERGDLRVALSAVAWTMMPTTLKEHKCAERGPATLTAKQRACPIWFWLEIGRALLLSKSAEHPPIHRGWPTMHTAIAEAFRLHYKRWTAADRMRMLLAWILQIRATCLPHLPSLWEAPALQLSLTEIDLPYKEIAAELAGPDLAIRPGPAGGAGTAAKPVDEKKARMARAEAKMADADAKIMAMMGLSEDDM